jgi:hypothetical protein
MTIIPVYPNPAYLLLFGLLALSNCRPKEAIQSHFPALDTLETLNPLPPQVHESSGLFIDQDLIWTHNDSGDQPCLYAFSPGNGKLVKKVKIAGAKAKDWEAITRDDQFVYIGDIGNNNGKRRDLTIYRIPLDSLRVATETVAFDAKIQFEYADQVDFKHPANDHNFDCEAMVATPDSLYLFSKNWADEKTTAYRIPNKNGNHIARPVDSFDVEGLITAAAYDAGSGRLCLLGYDLRNRVFSPFIWLFDDFPGRAWFRGRHRRFDLPLQAQTEAVAFQDSTRLFMTSEGGAFQSGSLFRLQIPE